MLWNVNSNIGVYKIENQRNLKVYIGSSTDIKQRWSKHKAQLRKNEHPNDYLQKSWNKYGEENFEFSVVINCSKLGLLFSEQYWMDFYKSYERSNGYNLVPTAHHDQHSEETKEKLSQIREGEDNPFYGRSVEGKHRERLSKSLSGRKISEEGVKNISEAKIGKKNPMYGEKGEDCPTSKLTNDEVKEIKKLFVETEKPNTVIADEFDVSTSCIRSIRIGESWTHIQTP